MKNFRPLMYEPKRNNRFIVEFPEEFGIQPFVIQSVTKPKLIIDKWQEITITMIDIIGPSTTTGVLNMVTHCQSKSKSFFKKTNLFTFYITSLDPTGVEIETWSIDVKKLLSVDFGKIHYGDDGIQMVTIKLQPKACKILEGYKTSESSEDSDVIFVSPSNISKM